jgi:hypothetical protein
MKSVANGRAEYARMEKKETKIYERTVVEDASDEEEEESAGGNEEGNGEGDRIYTGGNEERGEGNRIYQERSTGTLEPLEECAAVVARKIEVPARSSVTVAMVLELQQMRKGSGRRENERHRDRFQSLPEKYTLCFDANERMLGKPGARGRTSRDISDREYGELAGLEMMGGGFYLDPRSGETQEGLALAMPCARGEAMYIRVENKTDLPRSLPKGMELGVFKMWTTRESEKEGLEICGVAMRECAPTQLEGPENRQEIGDVQVRQTGMLGKAESEFADLATTLVALEPAERIKKLQEFLNSKWKTASDTPGIGFDSPGLEELLPMPDMLPHVKPTGWRMPGWRPNSKCSQSRPIEIAGVLAVASEDVDGDCYDEYVKLEQSYVRQRGSYERQAEVEWEQMLKLQQVATEPDEVEMMTLEAPSTTSAIEHPRESKFAAAFHQALAAVEVHFAPENPWGIQPEDEEEFESILRKPIEEADVTAEERKELEELCRKYYDVFRLGSCLKPVTGFEYDLELINPNTKPIFVRPRRINPSLLEKTHEHFDALVEKGVCEPADSPWGFALVVAPKRSQETGEFTDCRFCINFCPLNRLIKETSYNYQLIETVLDDVHASNFVTALDCFSGYHQLALSERTKQMTAFFLEGRGMLRYTTLPFGISSGTAVFSRLMDQVLEGIKGRQCAFIIDDILLHHVGFREHMETLERIFQRCRKFNLSLKAKKAQFMGKRVHFCGHVVEKGKLGQQQQKVHAISSWPTPRNSSDVRSFHGLAAYYRKFVAGFAAIAQPLTRVMAQDHKFEWGPPQQEAFDTLKERLAAKTMLVRPDWEQPFILTCDWCNAGIGCCLSQIQDGVEVPICFYSQVLRGAEQRYSATEGECLSLVWAVHKCKEYLQGRKFTLVTDHKALLYILDNSAPEPGAVKNDKIARWAMKLMAYSFDIKFRAGTMNVVADALSRRTKQDLAEEGGAVGGLEGAQEPDPKRSRTSEMEGGVETGAEEDITMTDKEREKWDDWHELVQAVSPREALTEVQRGVLLGLYFRGRAMQGLGRAEQWEWGEDEWRESMRAALQEEKQLAVAEARESLVGDTLAEDVGTTIIWNAKPVVEEGTRIKLMDAMAGSIYEHRCHVILGAGELLGLGGRWAQTSTAGYVQWGEGLLSADAMCMAVNLGEAGNDFFDFRVEELAARLSWLRKRGVQTIAVIVDLEAERSAQDAGDYHRLARLKATLQEKGFRGDARFLGQEESFEREGLWVPLRGAYALVVSSDAATRGAIGRIWDHTSKEEHSEAGRGEGVDALQFPSDCWPEFNLWLCLQKIRRGDRSVRGVSAHSERLIIAALEQQDDGVVGRAPIPSLMEMKQRQANDMTLRKVMKYVSWVDTAGVSSVVMQEALEDIPTTYRGLAKGGQFFMSPSGVLMRKDMDERAEVNRKPVVVAPRAMVPLLLAQFHEGASHLGRRKTLELIKRGYFWRGMEGDVRKHVIECRECMLVKQNSKQSKGFQMGLRPAGFMEEVFIDGYGPFAASATGNRYALTIVEKVSGLCVVAFLAEMNKFEVAAALHLHWFSRFGRCKFIISDNGNEFRNNFLATMLKYCGVEHRFSSIYNPRSNLSERVHSVFRACITIGCEKVQSFALWDYILANAVFCMNNAPLEGRTYSAHEILYGCNWKYAIEEEWDVDGEGEAIGLDAFVGGKREMLKIVRESIEDTIASLREDSANRVNLTREPHVFKVGDLAGRRLVQHSSEERKISAKFAVMSSGPYKVQEVNNEGLSLRLASEDGMQLFSMPSRECFHWTAVEEGRYELATPATRAEAAMKGVGAPGRDDRGIRRSRKNRPRDGQHRVDEDMEVDVRDEADGVDESADNWRDYDKSTRRMLQIQEATKKGERMVLVKSGPEGREKLRVARVVELTAFGDQGAFAAVHFHEVRLTMVDPLGGAGTEERVDLSEKGEWFVDRKNYIFEAIPIWLRADEKTAGELQPYGYVMWEEVIPLQEIVGEPFALGQREQRVGRGRVIQPETWEKWKKATTTPLAFRKSIVLTTTVRQHGTRSRAGEEELRRLAPEEVKKLTVEQLRVECGRRGIELVEKEEIGKDGTPKRLKKGELKRLLVTWILERTTQESRR